MSIITVIFSSTKVLAWQEIAPAVPLQDHCFPTTCMSSSWASYCWGSGEPLSTPWARPSLMSLYPHTKLLSTSVSLLSMVTVSVSFCLLGYFIIKHNT